MVKSSKPSANVVPKETKNLQENVLPLNLKLFQILILILCLQVSGFSSTTNLNGNGTLSLLVLSTVLKAEFKGKYFLLWGETWENSCSHYMSMKVIFPKIDPSPWIKFRMFWNSI